VHFVGLFKYGIALSIKSRISKVKEFFRIAICVLHACNGSVHDVKAFIDFRTSRLTM